MLTRTQSTLKPTIAVGVNPAHPLARSLAGCWLLNEGTGDVVHDASVYRRDGNFSGGPTWSVGRFGRAIEFDGTNDWISMGDCLDLGMDDLTILAIIRYSAAYQPDEWSGYRYGVIAGKGCLDGAGRGYGLIVNTSNQVQWQIRNQTSAVSAYSDAALNDGRWHLAVGVCDRDDPVGVRLYIDGVRQVATANATAFAGIDVNGSRSFAMGARQNEASGTWDWHYAGSVAMVCVWKRVLAEGEIRALQQNPFGVLAPRSPIAMLAPATSVIVECAGSIQAVATASATARVVRNVTGTISALTSLSGTLSTAGVVSLSGTVSAHSGLHGALSTTTSPTIPADVPRPEVSWRSEALLNGATSTAFQLGTVLTQGWFWVRRNGCTAIYRGPDLARVDLARILYVAEATTHTLILPAHLSHEPGSTYCYLVRRFNSCGAHENTLSAAVLLRIGPDGQQASARPNNVVGLAASQIGMASVRLTWFYCPLDQQVIPGRFSIHRVNAAGTGTLIGTVPYEGQRAYGFEAIGLPEQGNTFTVRAVSPIGTESPSSGTTSHQLAAHPCEPALILSADPI